MAEDQLQLHKVPSHQSNNSSGDHRPPHANPSTICSQTCGGGSAEVVEELESTLSTMGGLGRSDIFASSTNLLPLNGCRGVRGVRTDVEGESVIRLSHSCLLLGVPSPPGPASLPCGRENRGICGLGSPLEEAETLSLKPLLPLLSGFSSEAWAACIAIRESFSESRRPDFSMSSAPRSASPPMKSDRKVRSGRMSSLSSSTIASVGVPLEPSQGSALISPLDSCMRTIYL